MPSTRSIAGTTIVDVEREQHAADDADQRADDADQRALDDEDRMIDDGAAPSVRRIAMSACLSVTTITCAETMLNAATATISVRMMNITRFSICDRAEEIRVRQRPVADLARRPAALRARSRATCGAANRSSSFRRTPDDAVDAIQPPRVVEVDEREPAVELVHADLEDADDLEAAHARQRARRRRPCPAA